MKKEGFTLLEILAVIAIIGALIAIAIPSYTKIRSNINEKELDNKKTMILNAAELYQSDYKEEHKEEFDGQITVEFLLGLTGGKEYLETEKNCPNGLSKCIINPITNESMNEEIICFHENNKGRMIASLDLEECNGVKCNPKSTPSVPNLHSNMIPIKYDGTKWVKADKNNVNNNWYNYDNQMWANAVTVTEASRSSYQNATVGTPVLEADILTYMVWVPRYAYAIDEEYIGLISSDPRRLNPSEIHIKFESKNTSKSIGSAKNCDYYTHPAFTFGSVELDGIWVGKFMNSSSNPSASNGGGNVTNLNIMIKPNIANWRYIGISNMFTVSQNMRNSGNIYGYDFSVDTHIMKNMEWGAVAYLSHSKYGRCNNGICEEITTNNSSTNITGCAGDTLHETSYSGCKNAYNTTGGQKASTTGNIYGIYDMATETSRMTYVMGKNNMKYLYGSYDLSYDASGFSSTWYTNSSNLKYYDSYDIVDKLDLYNLGQKGDAMYETRLYYSAYNAFVGTTDSGGWYVRGNEGIFSITLGFLGNAGYYRTFRLVHI